MRRIAFLTSLPGVNTDTDAGPRYTALGTLTSEGRLVDAVHAAPAGTGLVYVCLETGHAFSRLGNDCDHLGTIFNLLHLHRVAQAFVHERTLPLVFEVDHAEHAFESLVSGAGVSPEKAREAVTYRAPLLMERGACVRAIIKGLPTFVQPKLTAFRHIDVQQTKVYG